MAAVGWDRKSPNTLKRRTPEGDSAYMCSLSIKISNNPNHQMGLEALEDLHTFDLY